MLCLDGPDLGAPTAALLGTESQELGSSLLVSISAVTRGSKVISITLCQQDFSSKRPQPFGVAWRCSVFLCDAGVEAVQAETHQVDTARGGGVGP